MQEDEEESVNSSSHVAAPEVGDSLIVRRALLKPYKEKEMTQRRSLFKTKCKLNDKVYKVVMDSGSTDNMVSFEMVDKIKLVRIPHEAPYKVSWLNDNQSLVVNEKALSEFHIGGYRDKVLCDVVTMDCCHLLLGRPWKFNKHTLYYGRANIY